MGEPTAIVNEQLRHTPVGTGIAGLKFGEIDYSKPFIPEHLTHLQFTTVYRELSPKHRLRYNQLFALYVNELALLFEDRIAPMYLRLTTSSLFDSSEAMSINRFVIEEAAHAAMFRRLNRLAAPELYSNSDFYFLRPPPPFLNRFLKRVSKFLTPAVVLLGTIQEERVTSYGDHYRSSEDIEPNFLAATIAHCGEECGHIDFGAALLSKLWLNTPNAQRIFNRWLFRALFKEYFLAPKRGGLRILARLIEEHPELKPLEWRLTHEFLALGRNQSFLRFLYSRDVVPNCMKLFDGCVELRRAGSVLPGYVPMRG